jgi:dTDP-4-amino-4,6-dideoxygalactose transaminase
MIGYSRQHITEDDIAAVTAVLRSDYITRGPVTRQLEDAFCEFTGKKYCVVVSNGTVALYMAVRQDPGSPYLMTSPLTFSAIANAALLNGCDVSFCDVDPDTLSADWKPESVFETEWLYAPMDYAGYPSLDKKHECFTILDACHGVGNTLASGESGTKYADIAVGSGHAVKQLTGSELGWLLTDDESIYERLKTLRDNGRKDAKHVTASLGFHTSEPNAALALSQLKRLPANIARRRELASKYYSSLGDDFRLILPPYHPGHSWHLYVVQLSEVVNCSRDEFRGDLAELGVGSQVHYPLLYRHPIFAGTTASCPVAEHAYERMLSIPMYYGLTDEQQEHVIESINRVLDKYSK